MSFKFQRNIHFRFVQAELFAESVLKIEGDEVAAIEIVQYLDELVTTLKMRRTDNYLSFQAETEKQKLVDEGHSVEDIESTCHEFFGNLFEL